MGSINVVSSFEVVSMNNVMSSANRRFYRTSSLIYIFLSFLIRSSFSSGVV